VLHRYFWNGLNEDRWSSAESKLYIRKMEGKSSLVKIKISWKTLNEFFFFPHSGKTRICNPEREDNQCSKVPPWLLLFCQSSGKTQWITPQPQRTARFAVSFWFILLLAFLQGWPLNSVASCLSESTACRWIFFLANHLVIMIAVIVDI